MTSLSTSFSQFKNMCDLTGAKFENIPICSTRRIGIRTTTTTTTTTKKISFVRHFVSTPDTKDKIHH